AAPSWSSSCSVMAPIAASRTRPASARSTLLPMRACARNWPSAEGLLQAGQVFGAGRDIVLRDRQHQVGHPGIVAARALAEVQHRLQQIVPGLAGEARLRPLAAIVGLVAAGAAERGVGARRALGDLRRGSRLLQVGPALL